jgi:hypothetical protein
LQQPVDIIIEEDLLLPRVMANYTSVFLVDANLQESAAVALTRWLGERPERTVWSSVGGGMLNELNASSQPMLDLFGLSSFNLKAHTMIQYVKQDLAFAPELDQVILNTTGDEQKRVGVYGARATIAVNASVASNVATLATFSDGSPAVISHQQRGTAVNKADDGATAAAGGGRAVLCAFHPSLSYFRTAIPPLPAQRGSTDASFNHFCPRDFDMAARYFGQHKHTSMSFGRETTG